MPGDGPLFAAFVEHGVFVILNGLNIAGHHLPEDAFDRRAVPVWKEVVEPVLAENLFLTVAEDFTSLPVDEGDVSVGIERDEHHAGQLKVVRRAVTFDGESLSGSLPP